MRSFTTLALAILTLASFLAIFTLASFLGLAESLISFQGDDVKQQSRKIKGSVKAILNQPSYGRGDPKAVSRRLRTSLDLNR